MNTYIKAIHKNWHITCEGRTLLDAAISIGADCDDLEVLESLTGEEAVLKDVPKEFHSVLSQMAYDRGHAYGQGECERVLENLVFDLLPAIKSLQRRLENKD